MDSRKRQAVALGLSIAIGVILGVGGLYRYATLNVALAASGRHDNDFKHLYAGAMLVANGQSPYDRSALQEMRALMGAGGINPYVYLPFTAQAMQPIFWGQASPAEASRRWYLLNHLFLWAGLALMITSWPGWRGAPKDGDDKYPDSRLFVLADRAAPLGLALLAVLGSFAVFRTLTAGQLNLALFAGYALVYFLLARRCDTTAGAAAAFIALFKLAPGLLIVYFAVARRWRAFWGMTAAGTALLALGMALAGPWMYLEFVPLARQMRFGSSTWGDVNDFYRDPANQSLNSFFHHALDDNPPASTAWVDLGAGAANGATTACALAILAALIFVGWRAGKAVRSDGINEIFSGAERAFFAAFVMGSLLLPSLMWDHYMTIAMIAWLVLLERSLLIPCTKIRWAAWVALGLLAIGLGVMPVAYWAPEYGAGAGLLLRSARLWPALALWAAALAIAWRLGLNHRGTESQRDS